MNKVILSFCLLLTVALSAQEHFSGINTSQRGGIINAGVNPAELMNFTSKYNVNILSVSVKGSNNKLGFSDLLSGGDFSDRLFEGEGNVDLRLDGEIYGPSLAYRINDWAFAFTTKAYTKLDLVDVNANLGDALTGSAVDAFFSGSSFINNSSNQRMNGTSWGEIGVSAAHSLYEDSRHKFSVGASLKLLFPGS
jgi:hypothetical protein